MRVDCGDLVVYSSPYDEHHKSIGRIIGNQREYVRVADRMRGYSRHVLVPSGCYWIQDVGPVHMALVRGKPICLIWPPWSKIYEDPDISNAKELNAVKRVNDPHSD